MSEMTPFVQPITKVPLSLSVFICFQQFGVLFRLFINVDILCVVVRFRSGNLIADVNITVAANNSADAQDIETNALNITSMDIGNITANNETYMASALNSTGKTVWVACGALEVR